MAIGRRLVGGGLGLGLGIAAAIGISGRKGFGEQEDVRVIHPPDREARMERVRTEGRMPELDGATGWINSPPLTRSALRGKVVVFEFWTYSCINWRRQLPYVRAWAERYPELVVIGVHTPEFGFEHDREGIERAALAMNVPYPIAIDSNYAVWQAFGNNYWPALYFVDTQGRIRHHQFGEGDYETAEMTIRQLLAEAGRPVDGELATVDPRGFEAQPELRSLLTPETYVGYARGERFASPGGALPDAPNVYLKPPQLRLAGWALAGTWKIRRESAVLGEPGGRVVFRFHARDVHLVMGTSGTKVRFRVRLDGHAPDAAHGLDVDAQGNGTITEPRLYQLIRQPAPVRDRDVEIEFLDVGAELFSFTFG